MAATPSNKKQVMDVAKPGKVAPSATTRPLIVGHGGVIKDPMVSKGDEAGSVPSPEAMNGQDGIKVLSKPRAPKVLKPLTLGDADGTESVDKDATNAIPLANETPSATPTEVEENDTPLPIIEDKNPADMELDKSSTEESSGNSADTSDASEAPSEAEETDNIKDEEVSATDAKTDADSENAAVVDAVVDQANIGKKQKEEDKEAQARKQLVSKLIEEKKYFVPIHQKSTTRGRGVVAGLLLMVVLLLAGGYAAVDAGIVKPGFDVPMHFIGKKEAAVPVATVPAANTVTTPQQTTTSPSQNPAPITGNSTYANNELGVSFVYPASWGEVAAKKQAGSISGTAVTFSFSKQPLLAAGMLSRDYKEHGRDGVCYVVLGVLPPNTLASIVGQITEGDGAVDAQSSYKWTTRILKKTADTFVYERFETGESTGTEVCLGISTIGYVAFKSSASYTGVQFYWGGDASSRKPVPASELNSYKSDPNKYLDDATRKSFISMVESAKSL